MNDLTIEIGLFFGHTKGSPVSSSGYYVGSLFNGTLGRHEVARGARTFCNPACSCNETTIHGHTKARGKYVTGSFMNGFEAYSSTVQYHPRIGTPSDVSSPLYKRRKEEKRINKRQHFGRV